MVRVGDNVRITAQLIDAPDDRHLWAKSYERDSRDVLALQDEVALAIAREINVELTPQEQTHLARAATVNPEAHEAYLKGRYYLDKQNEEGIKRAIEYFQKAIAADSQFAPAYSGLADAYSYGFGINLPGTDMEKARVAAQTALRLDETLAEAHSSLGFVKYQYDYDWKGSEHEFPARFGAQSRIRRSPPPVRLVPHTARPIRRGIGADEASQRARSAFVHPHPGCSSAVGIPEKV